MSTKDIEKLLLDGCDNDIVIFFHLHLLKIYTQAFIGEVMGCLGFAFKSSGSNNGEE